MNLGGVQEDAMSAVREFPSESPDFCGPFLDALPIERASVSTLGDPFDIETISWSDELGGRLSELQLDFGEGPCWDAHATGAAVLAPDLAAEPSARWHAFRAAIGSHGVRGVYSFPMAIGTLRVGAVDLYSDRSHALDSGDLALATSMARTTATGVVRYALEYRHDESEHDGPYSRREVHQATGMVIAQLGVSPDDALLIIRAHSYAAGQSVRDTAREIVTRRLILQR